MNVKVLKNNKDLDKSLYTIDYKSKIFASTEDNLNIMCIEDGWTFKTNSNCTFTTGSDCTFKTGTYCTFHTNFNCTFKTGSNCTFHTDSDCIFKIKKNCSIVTYIKNKFTLININDYEEDSLLIVGKIKYINLENKNSSLLYLKSEDSFIKNECKRILKEGF